MSRNVQTIMSPSLIDQVEGLEDKIVVVIDVLRATSTISTILSNGAKAVLPVMDEAAARTHLGSDKIVGGERGGKTIDGFDYGNSPFHYPPDKVNNKTVVLTTTNGTKCLEMTKNAKLIVVGCFLNLSAVCELIDERSEDVVLLCAGWRDKVNLEDSLFAGAVCHELNGDYSFDDASLLAQSAYFLAEEDLFRHLQQSNHFERLSKHGVVKDIEYCCQTDLLEEVPILQNGLLVIS